MPLVCPESEGQFSPITYFMSPIEKIVMAHCYLYFVLHQPAISDLRYDRLKKEAKRKSNSENIVTAVNDYPKEIIEIAMELKS